MNSFLDSIRDVEREIRELKRVLGVRWERPMADEQRRHVFLKKKATDLYVAVASSRGRVHLHAAPEEVKAAS